MMIPRLFPEGRLASACRTGLITFAAALIGLAACDRAPTEPPDDFTPQAAKGGRGKPSGVEVSVTVLNGGAAVSTPNDTALVLYLYDGGVGSQPTYVLNDFDGDGTITADVRAGSYVPVIKLVPSIFQGLPLVAPATSPDASGVDFANLLANAFAPVTQTGELTWGCASPVNLETSFGATPFVVPPSGLEITVEVGTTVCGFEKKSVSFPAGADGDLVYSIISRNNSGIAGSPLAGTIPGILAFVSPISNQAATIVCFNGADFGVELLASTEIGSGTSGNGNFNKVATAGEPQGCGTLTSALAVEVARCEVAAATGVSPFLFASYGYYFDRIEILGANPSVTKNVNRSIASTDLLVDLADVVYTITTRTDYDNAGRLTTEREVFLDSATGTCTYEGGVRRSGARNRQDLDISCQKVGDLYQITSVLSSIGTNGLAGVGIGFKGPNGATFPSVLGGYFLMTEATGADGTCVNTNDPVFDMMGW